MKKKNKKMTKKITYDKLNINILHNKLSNFSNFSFFLLYKMKEEMRKYPENKCNSREEQKGKQMTCEHFAQFIILFIIRNRRNLKKKKEEKLPQTLIT